MRDVPRSADYVVDLILNTPGMLRQIEENPEDTLKALAEQATKYLPTPAFVSDSWVYRVVVISLGVVAILAAGGAIFLSIKLQATETGDIPDVITALGSTAIGGLVGLISPSPTSRIS